MAGELSDSAEIGLLDHLLKGSAYPYAAEVRYLAIWKGDPGEDGQSGSEASYTGYSAQAIVGSGWNVATGRQIDNNGDVSFGENTGADETGCTHWTLWNHATNRAASNFLGRAEIPGQPVTVETSSTPTIEDATLVLAWNSGGLSNYACQKLLEHLVVKTQYTQPDCYAFLSSADPTDSFSGVNEPTSNGYARADANSAFGTGAAAGAKDNDAIILFPKATGQWLSGINLTHAGLYDAASAGNGLCYFALTTAIGVDANERPRFPVGDMNFTIN